MHAAMHLVHLLTEMLMICYVKEQKRIQKISVSFIFSNIKLIQFVIKYDEEILIMHEIEIARHIQKRRSKAVKVVQFVKA